MLIVIIKSLVHPIKKFGRKISSATSVYFHICASGETYRLVPELQVNGEISQIRLVSFVLIPIGLIGIKTVVFKFKKSKVN